jgi:hypothetical protein
MHPPALCSKKWTQSICHQLVPALLFSNPILKSNIHQLENAFLFYSLIFVENRLKNMCCHFQGYSLNIVYLVQQAYLNGASIDDRTVFPMFVEYRRHICYSHHVLGEQQVLCATVEMKPDPDCFPAPRGTFKAYNFFAPNGRVRKRIAGGAR